VVLNFFASFFICHFGAVFQNAVFNMESNLVSEGMSKILIVDDMRTNINILKSVLGSGHEIYTASTGSEALWSAEVEQPDLILLDVDMPDMDGYEVCEMLKSHPGTRDIPVIFVTGMDKEEDEEKGLKCGAIDYLTKPINPFVVLSRVKNHLELKMARDSMKELSDMKDKLFSIIAHDLRSPFTTLIGLTEMMVNLGDAITPEQSSDFISRINDSAKRTFALLENLLEWARLQMDQVKFEPKELRLKEVAQKTVDLLSPVAQGKGLVIENLVPEGLTAYADENMLDIVIRNLTNNAIKFSNEGGKITIGGHLGGKLGSIEANLTVSDLGVGMTPEQMGKIFGLSKENTTLGTKGEKGTGLGLLMCKELVEKNRGKIKVESEIERGSTFSVALQQSSGSDARAS
jgi:two-component system, sensor histidine kinase and response regulator